MRGQNFIIKPFYAADSTQDLPKHAKYNTIYVWGKNGRKNKHRNQNTIHPVCAHKQAHTVFFLFPSTLVFKKKASKFPDKYILICLYLSLPPKDLLQEDLRLYGPGPWAVKLYSINYRPIELHKKNINLKTPLTIRGIQYTCDIWKGSHLFSAQLFFF